VERIGGGQLSYANADAVVAVEAKAIAVILCAQFRVADIDEPNQRAVAARLEDDVVELLRIGQSPDGPHADLKHLVVSGGLRSNLPGSDLDVLLRKGGDDVRRCQTSGSQPRRIEPQAHGVLALAEDLHVGDALHSLQRVLDINV